MNTTRKPVEAHSRRRFLKAALGTSVAAIAVANPKQGQIFAPAIAQGFDEVGVQLNWIKSVQHGGHFAAIEKGYFREERLNVEILAGGPGIDSIALVANGRALIGDRDSANVILARGRGVPIRAFAVSYQVNPFSLISMRAKPVKTVQDMVGKTFAINPGRRPTIVALMRRAKIDPNSVKFVPASGDASILVSGQVDGYFGWSSNEGVTLKARGVPIEMVNVGDLGDPTYPQVFFATEQVLDGRRDLLVRWLRAEKRGWKYYADNPEEVARFTVEKYAQKGLDLAQQITEAKEYPSMILGGDARTKGPMWIDRPIFTEGVRLAKEANVMKEDVSVDALIDQRPLIASQGKA